MHGKSKIELVDAIIVGEKIWFSSADFNGLFSVDLSSHTMSFCGCFPDELIYEERLYDSLVNVGKKIYFIPNKAKELAIYDLEKEVFLKVNIPQQFIHNTMSFFTTIRYKEYIFACGVFIPVILCIDTKDNSIRYITSWYQEVEKEIFDEKEIFFGKQSVVIGNRILIPMCNVNYILEVNGDTLKWKLHCIGNGNKGYYGIAYDGENIWCSPRYAGNPIIQLDEQLKLKKEYPLVSENLREVVAGICCSDNSVWVFPAGEMNFSDNFLNMNIMDGAYVFIKSNDSEIIYFDRNESVLSIFDKKTKQLVSKEIEVDDKYFHLSDELMKRSVNERKGKSLEKMVAWVIENTDDPKSEQQDNIGNRIFNSLTRA